MKEKLKDYNCLTEGLVYFETPAAELKLPNTANLVQQPTAQQQQIQRTKSESQSKEK